MRWTKELSALLLVTGSMFGCDGDDGANKDGGSADSVSVGMGGASTGAGDTESSAAVTSSVATASQGSLGGASASVSTTGDGAGGAGEAGTAGSAGADTSTQGFSASSSTGQSDACYSPTQNPELSDGDGFGCACSGDAPVCVDGRRFECQQEVWARVGDGPCDELDACTEVVGQTFASVDELECGNTPQGPVYCHWTIAFDETGYQWMRSDAAISGSYSCEGTLITSEAGAASFMGELHADGSLTWDGELYQPQG